MNTKEFMRKFRSKLTSLQRAAASHCGHGELVERMNQQRRDLEEWVETEHVHLSDTIVAHRRVGL